MDYSEYPNNRKEAQKLSIKYYFTGQPCIRGHVALRKTKGACVECVREDWVIDNKKRSSLKIFSVFITKNAIVVTVLDVSTSLVMIRSSPYFRLLVPILPSITERFLKSDLNSSCCSAVCTSASTCFWRNAH
jgi:hypothetical protein